MRHDLAAVFQRFNIWIAPAFAIGADFVISDIVHWTDVNHIVRADLKFVVLDHFALGGWRNFPAHSRLVRSARLTRGSRSTT